MSVPQLRETRGDFCRRASGFEGDIADGRAADAEVMIGVEGLVDDGELARSDALQRSVGVKEIAMVGRAEAAFEELG